MNKNEIVTILNDWNFWNRDFPVGILRQDYLKRINSYISTNHVVVLIGARGSGKSYLLRQTIKDLIEKGTDKKNILFINFEDPRFRELDTNLLVQIFEIYLEFLSPDKIPYIFLDEIQEVDGWEKWVRSAQELNRAKIVISGSNAKLLSRDLSTLLTGRHLDITVFPLSFAEILRFNNIEIKNVKDLIVRRIEINNLLNAYFESGAFPEVILNSEKNQMLLSYSDDLINKDLIKRFKVRKTEKIKSLINFYLSNISSTVTFNSLTKQLGLTENTIQKYSSHLEDIFLVFFTKRFSFKVKEQDKSPRKVYCIDTGLANTLGFRFSENRGRLAENIVFLNLVRKKYADPQNEIFYWKDEKHREVDFVVKKGLDLKELIQVCWNIDDFKTKKREVSSLLLGMKNLGLNTGLIITENYEDQETIDGKIIQYVPLYKWLLEIYS